jgi:hypothetical protein
MAYELVLTVAGLGLGAWFVAASAASDRARQLAALLLAAALALRFVAAEPLAANLLFAAIAVGVLLYRHAHGGG